MYETAFYDVYSTFNMFKVRLLTKEVYKISCKNYYNKVIQKNKIIHIMYDKQCLLQVFRLKRPILKSNGVVIL